MSEDIKDLELSLNEEKIKLVGFEYRVENLEKQLGTTLSMLEKLDGKMDSLLEKISTHSEQNALASQSLEMVTRDYDSLLRRLEVCEKKVVDVQVSVAKKIAYGAGGGAIVTAVAQFIKMMG